MLAEFRDLVDDLVRDAAQWVTPVQRERAIGLALNRYSLDRPRSLLAQVSSPAGQALPVPPGWVEGESRLQSVEVPVGENPPRMLPSSSLQIYRGPLGEEIRLACSLLAGEAVRITFTAPHVVSETESSVPAAHREAVACYAASLLAEQIATVHAGTSEPTIAADSVDHAHPAREWAKRARDYRNRYFAHLGIEISAQGVEKPRNDAAGVVVEFDLPTSHGYGRYRGR